MTELQDAITKEHYRDYLTKRASSITSEVMNEEIDTTDMDDRQNYIESKESFNKAVEVLDEEWSEYSTLEVAKIYHIIKNNYAPTVDYIKQQYDLQLSNPEQHFREFVLYCVAYDISKMVDQQINQTIQVKD